MSKKPRNNYLQKIHIKQDGKYAVKKDKPWKPEKEPSIWDNLDVSEGFRNVTNAKRFSKHKYREFMQ